MFGFKKTSEPDRLRAVYADQSDGELLRLHEDRNGLTDAAKEALAEEMKQRGLAVPEFFAAEDEENAISVPPAGNEVSVHMFRDTYDLAEATRLLEEANIRIRLVDKSQWDTFRGAKQLAIYLMVDRSKEGEAKRILHHHLQLFPSNETEGTPDIALTPASDLEFLLFCDRSQALDLAVELSKEGVTFLWRDGREDKELSDEDTIAFEVRPPQREKADRAVQEWVAKTVADENESATQS